MVRSQNPQDRPLPSVARHLAAAFVVMAGVAGCTAVALMGEPSVPEMANLTLPERPQPPASDTLLADTDEAILPDLLEGVVEDGENPTVGIRDLEPAPPPTAGNTPRTIEIAGAAKPAALPRAPIDALQTRSTHGFVPMKAEDGRSVFRAYARPFKRSSKPTVSVIVGGLGINAEMTRRAIEELPPEVTLAFAAHAPDLQTQIDRARDWGHEVVLEVPMEASNSDPNEPGADRMLRVDAPAESLRNLDYLLSRASGYFAVAPYGGDVFLARTDAAAPVLSQLSRSGLGFLGDPQLEVATLDATAKAAKVPYKAGTMLIDTTPERTAIAADLDKLEARAKSGERALGFGFAYPATLDALILFLPTLEGVELAPASAAFPTSP